AIAVGAAVHLGWRGDDGEASAGRWRACVGGGLILPTLCESAFLPSAVFASLAPTSAKGGGSAMAVGAPAGSGDPAEPGGQCAVVDRIDVRTWSGLHATGDHADRQLWLEPVRGAAFLFGIICGAAAQLSRPA